MTKAEIVKDCSCKREQRTKACFWSLPSAAELGRSQIARSTGLEKAAVLETVEQFMTVVKDSLSHGENVYLRGFGSFIVKERAEKTARNISKNTTVIIPAHKIPAFKPSSVFVDAVKHE